MISVSQGFLPTPGIYKGKGIKPNEINSILVQYYIITI